MAFKIPFLADVSGFLKGTKSIEDELEKVSGSLDDLARDTATDADKAADDLKREFSDAFDKVKTEAKTAGDGVGDNLKRGSREAGEGMDTIKEESHQTAREVAASFDGSADSIVGMFQEVAANAFGGFGPAGAIAGIAAAAGIGIVFSKLQEADEAAKEARESVATLASELIEAHGDLSKADLKGYIQDLLLKGLDEGVSRLQKWTAAGINAQDAVKALAGDQEAAQRVVETMNAKYLELGEAYQKGDTSAAKLMGTNREMVDDFRTQTGLVSQSADVAKKTADALDGLADSTSGASEASADFSANLTDHLSVADEGLDEFVKKGKLNLKAWAKELKERAAETKTVEDFTVDVAPKLSDEALAAFEKLPTETQTQIAKAYKDGGKGTKKKVIENLEAEAKVTKVTVEGGKAAPVTIETKVDATGATKGTVDAANAAQDEANKSGNVIEFKTKIDRDDLQRQVNRAAASITPPTITVKTKVQKEVP